jgi:hypothetical protein
VHLNFDVRKIMKTNTPDSKPEPAGLQVKTGLQAGMNNPAAAYCNRKGGRVSGDNCIISLPNMRGACLPKPGPLFDTED